MHKHTHQETKLNHKKTHTALNFGVEQSVLAQ